MPLPPGDSAPSIVYDDEDDYNPNASLTGGRVSDISQQQMANAAIIYQVGRRLGMSGRDIQIGLITALVESNLLNVNYGDRDSLGLFQQRPSQGWGTEKQVMNPQYAAAAFFIAMKDQVGDRRFSMKMGDVAQAVQRSAYPERYAKMIPAMQKMWPRVQAAGGQPPSSIDGGPYQYEDPTGHAQGGMDTTQLDNYITGEDYAAGLAPANPVGNMPGLAPQMLTSLTDAVQDGEAVTPSADEMLGAWGMSSQKVGVPGETVAPSRATPGRTTGFLDDIQPVISPATNAQVIAPMQQEVGDFQAGVDGWRKAVISAARSALGTPYAWGGNSLQSGVDCSGLIQQAFARAGLSLPRVSYAQANFGQRVGIDALRPGDLVAWDNSSRNNGADHIALYIGNGQIIEAPRPGTAVRVRSLGEGEGAWGVQLNFDRR